MNATVKEWLAKAEKDFATARRELQVEILILMRSAFTLAGKVSPGCLFEVRWQW
jgi:hypothetical protein